MQLLTTTHGLTVSVGESVCRARRLSSTFSHWGSFPACCHTSYAWVVSQDSHIPVSLCVLLPQAAVPALIGLSGEPQSFFKPDFMCHL